MADLVASVQFASKKHHVPKGCVEVADGPIAALSIAFPQAVQTRAPGHGSVKEEGLYCVALAPQIKPFRSGGRSSR